MRKQIIPYYLRFLLLYYMTGLFFFFLFRLALFCFHWPASQQFTEDRPMIITSFLKGVQFDTPVMGYMLALPLLTLAIHSFFKSTKNIYPLVKVYLFTLMSIAFFICAVDIPYFNYNAARITNVIFNWTSNSDMVFSMIREEKSYWGFAILFVLLLVGYITLLNRLVKRLGTNYDASMSVKSKIGFSMLSFLLLFMALRARIDSPLKISHSFFCYSPFYNQLGLNPVFSLAKSFAESQKTDLIDEATALRNVQAELNILPEANFSSPVARRSATYDTNRKLNVVMVIMESMSADKMGHFGNKNGLTPFLDSIADQSYCFDNLYSAGRHTYNGIFSSLYAYPAILAEHPMSSPDVKQYTGLPWTLKSEGYENVFFTTHDPSFDNMGTFLGTNAFHQVISQNDYDAQKIQSAFGVPDHVMFQYALDTLDRLSKTKEPFFAGFMTVSDHAPYIIPKDIPFHPRTNELPQQIVEYADWSLRDFFERCKQKEWFEHTLFIFVADHGCVMGDAHYDIPLSYHHIPLLMYCADTTILKPKKIDGFGSQIDIFPTVMDILQISFVNTTLGVNLLKEKRRYAFFSSDDKVGCIDNDYFYIYNLTGSEYLHAYRSGDKKNYLSEQAGRAADMKTYSFSMIKTAKMLMDGKKTGPEGLK